MSNATLILLPGLHGTDRLFGPLLGVIPAERPVRVIEYPTHEELTYADLLVRMEDQIPLEKPVVLIAESYSGPLAIRYAAAHPERVQGVVLSASFARPPAPRWLRGLVMPWMFKIRPPRAIVRMFILNQEAPDSTVDRVTDAIRSVDAEVAALRLREVLSVNCEEALARCSMPILYLSPSHDRLVPQSSLRAIQSIRPDVRNREIEGPHLLFQSNPREAWEAIASFLGNFRP